MVLGGYPRSRYVRHTLRDEERGEVRVGEPVKAIMLGASTVIGAQVSAGLRFISDGMLDWHDIFRPFAEAWRNVAVDGLLRYFDNNFFYRIPVFLDEPEPTRPVLSPRVRLFKELVEPGDLKVVVPGPVTFARLSDNKSGMDIYELAERIAFALEVEVREAVNAGARVVQVDEPFLADVDATRDDAVLAAELAGRFSKLGATTILAVYFNMPEPSVYEAMLDAKVDYIAVDVIDAPERASRIISSKGYGGHKPVLGLIDARRVMDDRLGYITDIASKLALDAEEVGITTSAWLDLIPYRYSLRKTILVGRAVELVAERMSQPVISHWG